MISGESASAATSRAVRVVVRDVVAEVASEELPLVDGMTGLSDRVVVQRLRRRRGRRDPLGFGADEIAALATPVIWLAVDRAARQAADAAVDGAAAGMRSVLRKLVRKTKTTKPMVAVPPLTREQLVEVRRHVLDLAEQRGIAPDRAVTIADAVVARLALGNSDDSKVIAPQGPPASDDGESGAAGGK